MINDANRTWRPAWWFGPRPVLTVALPMYRSERIGWLALESLTRQIDATFPWELIVAEERDDAVRERGVRAYGRALRQAGCRRIHYLKLKKWMPLALKWRLIAQHASPASAIFLLQAADCYSPPRRLRATFDLMGDPGVDWCQSPYGAVHHLRLQKTLKFDATLPGYDHPAMFYLAMRTAHARKLPESERWRHVDRWLFGCVAEIKGGPPKVATGGDWWRGGLETKGLNNISCMDEMFERPSGPYVEDREDLLGELPDDVRRRLTAVAPRRIPTDAERRQILKANARRRRRLLRERS